jgi:dihydrofolate reductase
MINLIAAYDPNRVMGKHNSLPWRIKEDMSFFKQTTTDNIVIMGRNTYESIGKPLPKRLNIVLTKNKLDANVYCFSNFEESISFCKKINLNKKIFVIGGCKLYKYVLDNKLVDKMYISKINKEYDGDIVFPTFKENDWDRTLLQKFDEFELWKYTKNS